MNLIPAIIQEEKSEEILMLGYMDEKALKLTRKTGMVNFWSRKRKKIWQKGESSGNVLYPTNSGLQLLSRYELKVIGQEC